MGDKERAVEYLEKAHERREHMIINLKVAPWFDSLRNDPRYDALVKRLRLR